MANDRNSNPSESGSVESIGNDQVRPLNEVSDLSLENRIAAADQMGIPMANATDAATPDVLGEDETADSMEEEEDESDEETER